MDKKENSKPMHIEGLEDWMEQFFDDPFTSCLDEYQFRVDLFETQKEYIIEAELCGFHAEQVSITVNGNVIQIQVIDYNQPPINQTVLERMVTLPFSLETKKITARFQNNILEIFIKKKGRRKRKKKIIRILDSNM